MSLIEVLVAILIASGLLATAMETYRFVTVRTAAQEVEHEAVDLAASLLARADRDLPFGSRQSKMTEGAKLSWSVDGRGIGKAANANLTEVHVRVRLERAGIVVERSLSTLRVERGASR